MRKLDLESKICIFLKGIQIKLILFIKFNKNDNISSSINLNNDKNTYFQYTSHSSTITLKTFPRAYQPSESDVDIQAGYEGRDHGNGIVHLLFQILPHSWLYSLSEKLMLRSWEEEKNKICNMRKLSEKYIK